MSGHERPQTCISHKARTWVRAASVRYNDDRIYSDRDSKRIIGLICMEFIFILKGAGLSSCYWGELQSRWRNLSFITVKETSGPLWGLSARFIHGEAMTVSGKTVRAVPQG